MATEDSKLEVLHDHYKDTFTILQGHLQLRDRIFVFTLLAVTVILFQIFSPEGSGQAISQFVMSKLGLNSPIDTSFLGTIIWFATLALVVRYFQTVVYIERQYDYVHQLEEYLNRAYGSKIFTREGKFYLSRYPTFSRWTAFLYGVIFPALLCMVVVMKILADWSQPSGGAVQSWVNQIISGFILLSTGLYLLWIHCKK